MIGPLKYLLYSIIDGMIHKEDKLNKMIGRFYYMKLFKLYSCNIFLFSKLRVYTEEQPGEAGIALFIKQISDQDEGNWIRLN